MSNKVKDIDIKNHTFFDDIISIKYFDPNNINITDKQSYKNIII